MNNRQIFLADIPQGRLSHEHFVIREADRLRPAEGEVLLRTLYISLDVLVGHGCKAQPIVRV
ncbi:hypothetical protein [Pseudomonas chlororaphis]|uniref:hypothetical protein n=1 Tax=Pseudomonas chlororaphis TaxID=587753 RepID=UPI0031F58B9C